MKDEGRSRAVCVLLFRERGTQQGDSRLSQTTHLIGGMVPPELIQETISFNLIREIELEQTNSSLFERARFVCKVSQDIFQRLTEDANQNLNGRLVSTLRGIHLAQITYTILEGVI